MKFYFDMDGVLANFNYAHPNIARLNHPGNQLNDAERAAKKQFWLNIEKQENFWHDMPLMKDSEKMINAAKQGVILPRNSYRVIFQHVV